MDRLIFQSTSNEAFQAQIHQRSLLNEAAAHRLVAGLDRGRERRTFTRFIEQVRSAVAQVADLHAAKPVSPCEGA